MADLYELTAVPRDSGAERLRGVYEQHVGAAARAQDHQRLLALSRAYDALAPSVRQAMYPTMSTAGGGWSSTGAASRSGLAGGPSKRRPGRRAMAVTVALVAVVVGVGALLTRGSAGTAPGAGGPSSVALAATASTPTAATSYRQAASTDLQAMISGVAQCRRITGGSLPPSATGQVGQARLRCAGGYLAIYLHPGDRLDYRRTGTGRYTISVTAGDGETVRYNSATNMITP